MEARIAELIPRLRRYARALSTSGMASDDLVRATLERAGRELSLAQPAGDVRGWLFGLMHDVYVRALAGGETPPGGNGAAPGSFEQAIGDLTAGQREVFLLVTLEDMRYEEVARALNVPIGTVMSRLSRAREKLRLALMSQARLRASK
jgi:DNA-directed RNA polymerase specialized sigma24 family protein